MMKKIIVSFFLCALVLGVFVCANAEEMPTYISNEFEYTLLDDGTACITDYKGSAKKLDIPSELGGHSVTSIGDGAFYGSSLTSITIPDSVVTMGVNPFVSCSKLNNICVSPNHSVFATVDGVLLNNVEKQLICYPCSFTANSYVIPQGILSIGDWAFYDSRLTSITIPDSVTSIGDSAFYASSLTSITVPDSVTSIGDSAVYASSLTSITVPDSVTFIGDKTFYWCFSLTSIMIPDSVTSIGDSAFVGSSLASITIPNSVTSIGDSAFSYCYSLTSITIPDGVTSIGDLAFYCSGLTSITIPDSVTFIGKSAFGYCDNLVVEVSANSYAEQYFKDSNNPYSYTEDTSWLN